MIFSSKLRKDILYLIATCLVAQALVCSSAQVGNQTASVETGWDGDLLIVRSLGYGGPVYNYTYTTEQRRAACKTSALKNAVDIAYQKKLITLPKGTSLSTLRGRVADKGQVEAIDFDADQNCRAKIVFKRADLGA